MPRTVELENEYTPSDRANMPDTVNGFTLLNPGKWNRVMDLIEGIKTNLNTKELAVLEATKDFSMSDRVLALYDRLGGGIKLGDRVIAMGTFYDFKKKIPLQNVTVDEEKFADEYVLQRKIVSKKKTNESTAERFKRLDNTPKIIEKVENEENNISETNGEKPRRGRPSHTA